MQPLIYSDNSRFITSRMVQRPPVSTCGRILRAGAAFERRRPAARSTGPIGDRPARSSSVPRGFCQHAGPAERSFFQTFQIFTLTEIRSVPTRRPSLSRPDPTARNPPHRSGRAGFTGCGSRGPRESHKKILLKAVPGRYVQLSMSQRRSPKARAPAPNRCRGAWFAETIAGSARDHAHRTKRRRVFRDPKITEYVTDPIRKAYRGYDTVLDGIFISFVFCEYSYKDGFISIALRRPCSQDHDRQSYSVSCRPHPENLFGITSFPPCLPMITERCARWASASRSGARMF